MSTTKEDLEKAEDEAAEKDADESPDDPQPEREPPEEGDAKAEVQGEEQPEGDAEAADADGPLQLGYKRYVYAAYMAGAMLVTFLAAKIGHAAWHRLGQWKPDIIIGAEPTDEYLWLGAAVIGIGTALYYWRKPESRQYANEVAEELSKVTWPSRKEVTNSTTVVIVTTLFATLFFALMDRFWGYVTDQIYSF